ncbi:MAG: hypothetical protein FJ280_06775 [Planctomycetes bacterium]|nr:hypothetical protein [Planctomycetota bacterium]
MGFDIVDLQNDKRAPLARRETGARLERRSRFTAEGLALGHEALGPSATREADLVVVDEYGPRERQDDAERRAKAETAPEADGAAMHFHHALHQRQAQAVAIRLPAPRVAGPVELLEDPDLFLLGHANPGIADVNDHRTIHRFGPHGNRTVLGCVLDGIEQQIRDRFFEGQGISEDGRGGAGLPTLESQGLLPRPGPDRLHGLADRLVDTERLLLHAPVEFQLRKPEQHAHEGRQLLRPQVGARDEFGGRAGQRLRGRDPEATLNGGQMSFDIVRQMGHVLVFDPVLLPQQPVRLPLGLLGLPQAQGDIPGQVYHRIDGHRERGKQGRQIAPLLVATMADQPLEAGMRRQSRRFQHQEKAEQEDGPGGLQEALPDRQENARDDDVKEEEQHERVLRPAREMEQDGKDHQVGTDLQIDHDLRPLPGPLGYRVRQAMQQGKDGRIVREQQPAEGIQRLFPHRQAQNPRAHEGAQHHRRGGQPAEAYQPVGSRPQIVLLHSSRHRHVASHLLGAGKILPFHYCIHFRRAVQPIQVPVALDALG